ncbi:hypothetical protein IWW34DRAFT_414318 [Fusarium oxysporum f. sp. albedinis]|nr:hypothetical protein IWW34DRAFT_414318 [Fusarium oxysporum f. sp. albedinis]
MHLYPTRRLAFASQFTPCQPTLRANPRSDRCKVYLDHYFFLLSRQTCLGFLVKTPPANKMQLEGGVGEIGNPRLLFHQLRLLALLSVSALVCNSLRLRLHSLWSCLLPCSKEQDAVLMHPKITLRIHSGSLHSPVSAPPRRHLAIPCPERLSWI